MSDETYKARYWRYYSEQEEECDTLDEAVAFLSNGWERGNLSEIAVIGPDGTTALSGERLHQRMMSLLGT
ncbi:predicted protein [Streptomyces viridosporus ATCC 14672]|uniref:Predicted protein n=1 Tax=Streptomyces viridosporus (strain ATCC 14672 / DSM 40746 / JCM 4963 / KCTC 9882 / NRRL B-12104 / FH 1290) TaxID=566461 RepID=D6A487_STRV1|nr:hypothetical protein [Streptomyces viridosporus]EFE65727.1 predicted protein [Streptomyces viridosporus ATCC 14672]